MDIQATKLELIQYLLNTEKESLLLKVKELVLKERVVGHTGKGEPLTVELLNAKLERAEADYKAGRTTTDEDLAREMEHW
ncbi:hypothetical protein [Sinomicrobium soli]|uniref:hypothetical protein n=1 Tax=Sinomicrobium sp. N-1-3-6 TaxID=2219864 RepID=UPI0013749A87|nr:hypothetical protein [Sinomicrobium sp. N-1-3-6]